MTKFGTQENRATQALMTIVGEILRYRYPLNAVVQGAVIQQVVFDAAPLVFANDADIAAATLRVKRRYEALGLLSAA